MEGGEDWRSTNEMALPQYWHMQQNSILTDCAFQVGTQNERLEGHKLILARASSVFHAMLYGLLAERGDVIVVEDIEPRTFKDLLQFVYCDNLELESCKQALDLCYAANKYMLHRLVKLCMEHLYCHLDTAFLWQTLELARLLDNDRLKEVCMQLLRLQTTEIVNASSFEEISRETLVMILQESHLNINSELVLIRAVLRWAVKEIERWQVIETLSIREVLGPQILSLIRFLSLKPEQFTEMLSIRLLTASEKYAIIVNILSPSNIPMPEYLSSEREPRSIQTLHTKHYLLKRTTIPTECPGTFKNVPSMKCSYNFSADQDILLKGIFIHSQKSIYKKRKTGDESHLNNYEEKVSITLLKLVRIDNLENCEMLLSKQYENAVSYDSTARIMFDVPMFLESKGNTTYLIVVKLFKAGTYWENLKSKVDTFRDIAFTTRGSATYDWGNSGIVASLVFFAANKKD